MSGTDVIGIIGGGGWLGRALGRAMLRQTFVDPRALVVSSRSGHCSGYEEWPQVRMFRDNRALAAQADVVVLSVRPEDFDAIDIQAPGKLVISLMAGVPANLISQRTKSRRVVRAMPNAAAEIGRSYTPWFSLVEASAKERTFVQSMFETCGQADEVPQESDIDYMTGLTGSGPALPALVSQAMINHAIARGLAPSVARRAVKSVVAGASQLLAADDVDIPSVIDTFLAYDGTTAAALAAMQRSGLEPAIHAGLEAAEARAMSMSAERNG
ncbi:NAD(P)-binding domain-containing protein [Rhizobiaceae bacterium n13]|uniref:Pyrroline-5-carboxylate reductase n=1 Tax=Ferirhizobium litorale TaxID=2927786 RepID=A0AAE3U0Y8_9HYPH|nr:pyrroline-5-carboxylate reductase dimerization domain-containing protein [Fererhizobium litorale]MDI7861837.1 NAD(P)-binding domain-containing protein [Fererhizobium litorale]MDI7921821.1 NAD(P)-binding domain-containing protein [Fererhizobium litorale]